jgi:hypothetical protein
MGTGIVTNVFHLLVPVFTSVSLMCTLIGVLIDRPACGGGPTT